MLTLVPSRFPSAILPTIAVQDEGVEALIGTGWEACVVAMGEQGCRTVAERADRAPRPAGGGCFAAWQGLAVIALRRRRSPPSPSDDRSLHGREAVLARGARAHGKGGRIILRIDTWDRREHPYRAPALLTRPWAFARRASTCRWRVLTWPSSRRRVAHRAARSGPGRLGHRPSLTAAARVSTTSPSPSPPRRRLLRLLAAGLAGGGEVCARRRGHRVAFPSPEVHWGSARRARGGGRAPAGTGSAAALQQATRFSPISATLPRTLRRDAPDGRGRIVLDAVDSAPSTIGSRRWSGREGIGPSVLFLPMRRVRSSSSTAGAASFLALERFERRVPHGAAGPADGPELSRQGPRGPVPGAWRVEAWSAARQERLQVPSRRAWCARRADTGRVRTAVPSRRRPVPATATGDSLGDGARPRPVVSGRRMRTLRPVAAGRSGQTQGRAQHRSQRAQVAVARQVPVAVVDLLELVEIEHEHAGRAVLARCAWNSSCSRRKK